MSEMLKSSGDKESPRKITLLMLMLSDIKVLLSCVRANCLFHSFILCFRKPITQGDTFNSSKDLRIHSRRTLLNAFLSLIHTQLKFRFLFSQFLSIIILIISWSLQPYKPRLHPFCSSGKRSFCSRFEYVLSVRTDIRSWVVEKQVIG